MPYFYFRFPRIFLLFSFSMIILQGFSSRKNEWHQSLLGQDRSFFSSGTRQRREGPKILGGNNLKKLNKLHGWTLDAGPFPSQKELSEVGARERPNTWRGSCHVLKACTDSLTCARASLLPVALHSYRLMITQIYPNQRLLNKSPPRISNAQLAWKTAILLV